MRQKSFSPVWAGMLLGLFLIIAAQNIIAATTVTTNTSEPPLTIREVAKDLACPCQCPLILQDCNMSCGLTWKEEIGKKIAEGMNKQQVTQYFIAKYGDSARLTPIQKIQGKIYQYTRGFGTMDWVVLSAGVLIWLLLMFFAVYFLVKKFRSQKEET
jgi:cytochrome c-type biogenesis protein CcmH/NrfF